jgi:hypothetical protein
MKVRTLYWLGGAVMIVMGTAFLGRGRAGPADLLVWLAGVIVPGLVYIYLGARPDRARAGTTRSLFIGCAVLAVVGLLVGGGDIDWHLLQQPTIGTGGALLLLGGMTLLIGLGAVPSERRDRRALLAVGGMVLAIGFVQIIRVWLSS